MSQAGYSNSFEQFLSDDRSVIVDKLKNYIKDAGDSQVRAWRDSIKVLHNTIQEFKNLSPEICSQSSIILEYTIPLESRRVDAILLLGDVVLSTEFKGKNMPLMADIDQAAAYARDLKAYHRDCASSTVKCLLVLSEGFKEHESQTNVEIIGSGRLTQLCMDCIEESSGQINLDNFLSLESYQPLPSLIKAARELFSSGTLTRIHRAAAATEPTLEECSSIIHETAKNKRRALILISGVPGAGKTLVGLQLAHAKYLDELSIAKESGEKPNAAAVFLSGNGPLTEVLQYELKSAGGDGKSFVRGVHSYVKNFTRGSSAKPPHHVLIYDEAQRAFDPEQVSAKHRDMSPEFQGLSEPEIFIKFAESLPEWCVVVGLIGTGQEIHIGEEAGLGQWRSAINKSNSPDEWDVYAPNDGTVDLHFKDFPRVSADDVLELTTTIRFHLATRLYEFVEHVLNGNYSSAKEISFDLEKHGYNLRLTHILDRAKEYLSSRYDKNPDARFGMIASAKDKDLKNHGIPKGFKSHGEVSAGKYGKWYAEARGVPESCCSLEAVTTEFGAQGLELDACLLAWGTDFIIENGQWSNRFSAGYRESNRIKDAKALRMNSYRVLLTRGRDCCTIFIPQEEKMRATFGYLRACGFKELL
ncbi:DUF2075 domain-containing protein [Candidatus Pseudothioglobus singularis]|nr:DUF2075 domain-containing protein [Candidatus Pseudothioglobus singularis]